MNRDRFETLVGRYLDQAIDEEEAKELLEAISRQPDLCEEMLRDVGTAQALERWGRPDQEGLAERVMARLRDAADGEHMVEDVMRRLPRGSRPGALPAASGRRPPKRYVVGAAVAACLLLAVTFALLSRRTPAAQLLETDEGVVVRRGDREIAGTVDLGLRWEDKLDVPDGRLAVIEFTDQTRIECEGAASLSLRRDDKKRWVEVSSGRLDVHVRPQAERQPMTV
ncbi:MAG: hypothetical protein GY725_12985, partial [bacterium]|nr:hypothetical protein [bacterium]